VKDLILTYKRKGKQKNHLSGCSKPQYSVWFSTFTLCHTLHPSSTSATPHPSEQKGRWQLTPTAGDRGVEEKARREEGKTTESQTGRGWKGPLWII